MAFFLSFLSGVVFFHLFRFFPYTSLLLAVAAAIIFLFKKKYLLIPVIAFGVLYAFLRYAPADEISQLRGEEILITGNFNSEAVTTSTGKFMQGFHAGSAAMAGTGEQIRELEGKDIFVISDAEFETRNIYELTVKITKDRTKFSPGILNDENIYANLMEAGAVRKDEKAALGLFGDVRLALNRYIEANFNPDSGALVAAMTTGRRSDMSEELRKAFNSTGLAHILSISGTHFGLLSVFLFSLFRLGIKYLPYRILQRITIYISPSQGAAVLCLPFMVVYLGISGWSIPALRSFIMISLFLIGLLIGRKGFWFNSLLFSAFVIVLWSPDAILSLSFQLSFLAVLCIGFSVGYMEDRKSGEVGKRGGQEEQESGQDGKSVSKGKKISLRLLVSGLQIFRTSMLISLAASLGTAPLVAYYFHYFSIISPLSNLIITPVIGFIILPMSLMSAFIFIVTGYYPFATLINMVAEVAIYLIKFMAGIPFSDIKVTAFPPAALILFYAGFIPYFLKKNRYTLLIPLFPLIAYIAISLSPGHGLSVTYLDVGQGDSSVIELPDKKTIVIDTGRTGKETEAFLRYKGKRTIDALVLSHNHPDHTGGFDSLIRNFRVKEIWDNKRLVYPVEDSQGLSDLLAAITHRGFERGDVVEGKGYKIYVLHPYKEFYIMEESEYDEDNNSSLVLKVEGKGRSFLFTGDVEEEAEENIAYLGKWLKSGVMKVPHHGGKTSASEWFFNTVSPEIAVISAGRENSFGHPHQETLDKLANSKVFRTDIHGAVKITEKDGGLEVKTYKDFQFAEAKDFNDELKNLKRLFEVW